MRVAAIGETRAGECRVALVPAVVPALTRAGCEVVVESGAGQAAGYTDEQYRESGAQIVAARDEAFAADVLLMVHAVGLAADSPDRARLRRGQVLIGMFDPLGAAESIRDLAATGVSAFALELIPRITRAQSMDVLSSMATVAGYRAVLLAAIEVPRMFPLLMTAAGTITPVKAFVIGVGVAGLQAIATARRLGAVVQAYDVRPAVREQVESLGAKFVELPLETGDAEDRGGYAKSLGDEFYRRQRELLAKVIAGCDVVISTAAIPGKPSPLLITAAAVRAMQPGSVIVDLAAERGGNCELSQADEKVDVAGVTILGPTNLPSEIPYHASQMYAKNISTYLLNMVKDRQLAINWDDEIVRETQLTHDGELVSHRLRELLLLPPLVDETAQESSP